MSNLHDFSDHINYLKSIGQFRTIPQLEHQGKWIFQSDKKMLNMSSNDYLGLANDEHLKQQFLEKYSEKLPHFTSSSSRLLTGAFSIYEELENSMAYAFQRESCLLFNSGYHANIGILPAVSDKKTLILADKLVHASLIDGIRLSESHFMRYRHNDFNHLEHLLSINHNKYQRIIIVTESVFSMDGDVVDLQKLVELKVRFENVLLYVDEAHAIGVYGDTGLGIAQQQNCIQHIDFLVGTFGKAFASMGAYVICHQVIKDYLINNARPFIFSTALPPFSVAWTLFLFEKLPQFRKQREQLFQLSHYLRQQIALLGKPMMSQSCIVPYIIGENKKTQEIALILQQQGYYCLPIRPPTVPKGTSRIRLSLTANMELHEIVHFVDILKNINLKDVTE